MLKKTFRLKGEEVKKIFKSKPLFFQSKYFNIFYLSNNLKFSRFSVKHLNKIFPLATERNRLKRRIYEILRKNFNLFNHQPKDVIIIVKAREVLNFSFKDLEEEILKILKNL